MQLSATLFMFEVMHRLRARRIHATRIHRRAKMPEAMQEGLAIRLALYVDQDMSTATLMAL